MRTFYLAASCEIGVVGVFLQWKYYFWNVVPFLATGYEEFGQPLPESIAVLSSVLPETWFVLCFSVVLLLLYIAGVSKARQAAQAQQLLGVAAGSVVALAILSSVVFLWSASLVAELCRSLEVHHLS